MTLSATLKTSTNVLLASKTVTFTLNGSTFTATTNGSGVASVSTTAPATAGSYTIVASFAGDSSYGASTKSQTLTDQYSTKLTYTGPTTDVHATSVTLSATLKTTAGAVIVGRTVTFKLNGKNLNATTNSSGVASVSTTSPSTTGNYTIAITLNGDTTYAKTSVNATLTVT